MCVRDQKLQYHVQIDQSHELLREIELLSQVEKGNKFETFNLPPSSANFEKTKIFTKNFAKSKTMTLIIT